MNLGKMTLYISRQYGYHNISKYTENNETINYCIWYGRNETFNTKSYFKFASLLSVAKHFFKTSLGSAWKSKSLHWPWKKSDIGIYIDAIKPLILLTLGFTQHIPEVQTGVAHLWWWPSSRSSIPTPLSPGWKHWNAYASNVRSGMTTRPTYYLSYRRIQSNTSRHRRLALQVATRGMLMAL